MTRGLANSAEQIRETFEVSTDLTGNEHKLVNFDSNDQLQLVGSAGVGGFVLEDPKDTAGEEATVIIFGRAAVEAGGAIDHFDQITSNGSGQAVTANTTGDEVIGVALEDADSGDLVQVFVTSALAQMN